MNIICEAAKERGTTVLIPSSMVDIMNPAAAVAVSLAAKTGAAQAVLEKPVH